jgi:catenin alpha
MRNVPIQVFTEHANKLVEVANLACSMSDNEEGVKLVRVAAGQIESLCPQVINAARILAARPRCGKSPSSLFHHHLI